MDEKLQKVLARAGVASRRAVEQWIEAGRVTVNDQIATIGQRVSPTDQISVDGKPIKIEIPTSYEVIIYNKPLGEICSENDPEGRRTVFEALPPLRHQRWIMVGRLDINTSGLILFTTNGELANRLMHPKYEIEREYMCRVSGNVSRHVITTLKKGVILEDGPAKFDRVDFVKGENLNVWYRVMIKEGRKREVRRLWESQHLQVNRLFRSKYGCISLPDDLPQGKSRQLSPIEKQDLANLVSL